MNDLVVARLNSALGLAHPHYNLLIHSMLWEIGANMELAMLSRRKTCADRIKHPDAGTEAAPLNPDGGHRAVITLDGKYLRRNRSDAAVRIKRGPARGVDPFFDFSPSLHTTSRCHPRPNTRRSRAK
jgi:hypothetical protein